jgi:hypothetical protein
LKVATTTWETNQKHEENYDEYKVRVVVGDHGAPNHSHFRFRQSVRLPTIVNGISHLNKCILYSAIYWLFGKNYKLIRI